MNFPHTTQASDSAPAETVLIVDDNRDLVEFVTLLLSHHGFRVRSALNGPDGLEIVRNEAIDLVILDVMMPKMDGILVCKELKRFAPSLPVIFLTAKDDLATRSEAMTIGVSEFLAKPMNIDDFLNRIRSQLRVSQWVKNIDAVFADNGGDLQKNISVLDCKSGRR